MISSDHFWKILKNTGFSFFSGVPCSILKPVLSNIPEDVEYVIAVREDSALGIASGAYLTGRRSAIFIQNSGLGNIINALTSFSLIYRVPVLLVITWRGEPGEKDAPEHLVMGKVMLPILDVLNLSYKIINRNFKNQVDWAVKEMKKTRLPVALVLKEGVVR